MYTIEDSFEYQMKKIITEIKKDFPELSTLDSEVLQDKLWSGQFAVEFARKVLDACYDYSGDELFK